MLQIDGLHLVQKAAITRYLARKHNMYGSNPEEAVQCDIIAEGIIDFKSKFKDFDQSFRDACQNYMPKFERILRSNKNGVGFLVGESISFGMPLVLAYLIIIYILFFSGCAIHRIHDCSKGKWVLVY